MNPALPLTAPRPSTRWLAAAGAGLATVVLATVPAARPAGATAPSSGVAATPPGLAPQLADLARREPSRRVAVIVQGTAAGDGVAGAIRRAGGRVTVRLPILRGAAATVTAAGAARLATDPAVRAVSPDAQVRATDDGTPSGLSGRDAHRLATAYPGAIDATEAWGGRRGVTGRGVGVAVIDTGIAGDLADFRADDGSSRIIASAVVHPDATTADDSVGHGTHVAGLIAGNGTRRDDRLAGRYVGVAPDANLISVKVANEDGGTRLVDVIAGLQFVIDHKDDLGIRVVNLSLNSTVAESPATDPLDAAVEVAWRNGLTVVAAAGNRGSSDDAVSYAPANDPYVITAGAVDDHDTPRTSDDTVPAWSSRGVTQTGAAKPDVLAPGAHLVSTLAPGSSYATSCPSCVVDGSYLQIGGTSMSAAVTSGAAALLLQAHPDWTPDQVKGALASSSGHHDGREIDVDRALKAKGDDLVANEDATPSTLLPDQGGLDLADWTRMSFTRMSFTRMSFTSVDGSSPLSAAWSRMSFTCACRPTDAELDSQPPEPDADPQRMSFTRMSFTRMSFTASFTK